MRLEERTKSNLPKGTNTYLRPALADLRCTRQSRRVGNLSFPGLRGRPQQHHLAISSTIDLSRIPSLPNAHFGW
jgi:hypothetical protein